MKKTKKFFFLNQSLKNLSFLKFKYKNSVFENCKIEKCNFWESSLVNSKFKNTIIKNSIFTDSNLSKSVFLNSTIRNTNFSHSNLLGADFSSSKLININLRDAVYDKNTKWPTDFNVESHKAIKYYDFNPFNYNIKLPYSTIKNLSFNQIQKYKKSIKKKKESKLKKIEKNIIYDLTKGKGYYIIKNFYSKNKVNIAEKIIDKKIKYIKGYKKIIADYSIDKKNKSINIYSLLNLNKIFVEMIQPKIIMNAFKKLMGENFICTWYAAQCSLAGCRGQNLHLDYPYVNYKKPGDDIPHGMGSDQFLLSCGVLTYLNEFDKNSSGPIILKNSHKFRKFPTIEDVKKNKFIQVKLSKGSVLILNTLIWHAGLPNYSENKNRHLLVAHYTPDFVKLRMNIKKETKKAVIRNDKGILKQLLT